MIKIENIVLIGNEMLKAVIRGMRNPMNSWERSDTTFSEDGFTVGPSDLNLMTRLCHAGTEHRKFLRMIPVYVDITAPLYWWKEFDTYKIGTVRNSCSTMHKISSKPFEISDFSAEHLLTETFTFNIVPYQALLGIINCLNENRKLYLESNDKKYWWQMIQLLPSSYNQKATIMLNYEVLANIYRQRDTHKLDEWREFCKWIESLPYSNLITKYDEC